MCLILGKLINIVGLAYIKLMGSSSFCIAYRNVEQQELMGSHEEFDSILDDICIDVRVIRGTIEC